jgi:hypothetical protein
MCCARVNLCENNHETSNYVAFIKPGKFLSHILTITSKPLNFIVSYCLLIGSKRPI